MISPHTPTGTLRVRFSESESVSIVSPFFLSALEKKDAVSGHSDIVFPALSSTYHPA